MKLGDRVRLRDAEGREVRGIVMELRPDGAAVVDCEDGRRLLLSAPARAVKPS